MPDYNNGKIYCIRSPNTDLIYIGSTCQKLSQRIAEHRNQIKKTNRASKIIFEYGDAYIELLENYSCNNKEELLKKEGEYIRNNNCCNKYISGRTHKEYRLNNKEKLLEYAKEYYEITKEHKKEYRKQYYEDNKEKILEREKQYNEVNKEHKKEYAKQYYEDNKEKLLEQNKQYRLKNKEKL